MKQEKIDRINYLAGKSRSEGLTEAEKEEQQILRREYIDSYKASLVGYLDNSVIQRPDGTRQKVKRKNS